MQEQVWLAALRDLDAHDEELGGRTPSLAQRLQRERLEVRVRQAELSLAGHPGCPVCGEYCWHVAV